MIAVVILAAMVVFVGSLWGWDIPVTGTRYFPKKKARTTTLCLLPIFLMLIVQCDYRMFGAAWIAYVVLFSVIGTFLSKKKAPDQPSAPPTGMTP